MGNFRIVVDATGGHGCQREYGDGAKVFGCRRMDCPDCLAQDFVEKMSKIATVSKATLTHWPETPGEVVDEFVISRQKIVEYKKSKGVQGEDGKYTYIETDEIDRYIENQPIHRIRHGKF